MRRVLRINEANSRCRNLVDLTQKFKKILHDGGRGGGLGEEQDFTMEVRGQS